MPKTRERVRLILTPDEPPASQIVEQIERLVALGVYRPGDELPSASSLGTDLGISRITVQKAYGLLVERKVAETRVGAGTYIATDADTRNSVMRRMLSTAITLGQNLFLEKTEIVKAFEHEINRHFKRAEKPARKRD